MKTYLKKNKALLILPLVLLPFVVLIFYILGGGKTEEANNGSKEIDTSDGVNYILPEAERNIEIFDKLEAYQRHEERRPITRDYNIMGNMDSLNQEEQFTSLPKNMDSIISRSEPGNANADIANNLLAHIKQKEKLVKKDLEQHKNTEATPKAITHQKKSSSGASKNITKQSSSQPIIQTTGIEELDKVFDENIALDRENDSLKFYLTQAEKQLLEIELKKTASFSLEKKSVSGFNGDQGRSALIKAEIYETATVLNGNRVKMRLLEDSWLNGKKVAKNTFIYGICKINNERLHITITQFPVKNTFLPVDLLIHDLDGLPGLYVPDNVARKVSKEIGGSTNTSSMFGMTNNPFTYAGIRAADRTAQTLLKRVKLKRVTVKKNTLVYLINQKQ